MTSVAMCDSPFSLGDLAGRIRRSSNFRFAWQFYELSGEEASEPLVIRDALAAIISAPALHRFLRDSFDSMYEPTFRIQPLHEHCHVNVAAGAFEDLLAAAAADHLGAYSQELRDASEDEKEQVRELFRRAGDYLSYQLSPGEMPGCETCRDYNNHLFTNWFFGVVWDWCLLALWPQRNLLWLGCLTDTD